MSRPSEEARDTLTRSLGVEVDLDEGFGPAAVDVPAGRWADALTVLRDELGYRFFDWLSAVDELDEGFLVVCHLARIAGPGELERLDERARALPGSVRTTSSASEESNATMRLAHLLVRTRISRETARLSSVTDVYPGAGWHERETHEMFGIDFDGNPDLSPLLLPEEFEGHPLRKEFVLASRVAKPWPGAKEPGESDTETRKAPSRRRVVPPGVPAPDEWGPRPPGSGDA